LAFIEGDVSVNKIGIYYAYWCKDYDADFSYYASKVSKLEFDVFEVNADAVMNISSTARQNLKELVKKENLEMTFCMGLANKYDISVADESIRRRGIDYLKRIIEMVSIMDGKKLSGILYAAWNPVLPERDFDKGAFTERSVESMKKVIKTAEDFGVYCNVEVVNRFEQFILNTCKEAVDYVKMVDSPNIKILLDTYHMNIEEDSIEDAIIKAGDTLGHLHIGENNRKLPGQGGHIPWDEVVHGIKKINYEGNIVMEPFIIPDGEVGRDIKVWRDMSIGINFDEKAKEALTFIREKLRN
jgi:D-psicose/D-tagatose/L-ribulose 3-epimerase